MSATQNRKHTKLEIWTSMEKHNWKLEHGFSFLLLKNLNNHAHTTIASVTVFILNYRIITFKHTYIHTYIYIYIYIYIERERERERDLGRLWGAKNRSRGLGVLFLRLVVAVDSLSKNCLCSAEFKCQAFVAPVSRVSKKVSMPCLNYN